MGGNLLVMLSSLTTQTAAVVPVSLRVPDLGIESTIVTIHYDHLEMRLQVAQRGNDMIVLSRRGVYLRDRQRAGQMSGS